MTRNEYIHSRGFDIGSSFEQYRTADINEYKKIKVGVKQLEDAVLQLNSLEKINNSKYGQKSYILKCISEKNMSELRNISRFYYNLNGIYSRTCDYFASLYRYDWYVMPFSYDNKNINEEKLLKDFAKTLNYLDKSYIKKMCNDIALKVMVDGAYYGYYIHTPKGLSLQDLPVEYCRSRYSVNGMPTVEFDMRYFDTFRDSAYRMKVLKLFPDEFAKGYLLHCQNKLKPEYSGDTAGSWYLLDPQYTVKFTCGSSDIPMFIKAIPSLIDLDAAQNLDRRRQMQQLTKILIQKLPMDKNGELIFDVDEARDIHNNACHMLSKTVGVDVLTTFADVESVNLSDKNTSTSTDDLERVERGVFNSLGISRNLFNTDGNMSLEKSILNDESDVRNLLFQFNMFFDKVLDKLSNNKKYGFQFYMLETTQYNYKELAKLYKEQTQIGYSKLLPQIALGHSQSFILNSITFENDVLHLSEIMIPPLMSSTMNSEDVLGRSGKENASKSETKAGRPEKPNDQKSDKTIQNLESKS